MTDNAKYKRDKSSAFITYFPIRIELFSSELELRDECDPIAEEKKIKSEFQL